MATKKELKDRLKNAKMQHETEVKALQSALSDVQSELDRMKLRQQFSGQEWDISANQPMIETLRSENDRQEKLLARRREELSKLEELNRELRSERYDLRYRLQQIMASLEGE